MKLEEAISRLRTCAQRSIDLKKAALEVGPQPHTRQRIEGEIDA